MPNSKSDALQLVNTEHAPVANDLLDACGLAMDQALGLEKTSLSALSQWNAQAMELAWSFAPVFCDLFHLTMRSFAGCIEMSRYFCLVPYGQTQSGAPQLGGDGEVIDSPEAEARQISAELASCMDAAIGAESVDEAELVMPVPPVLKAPEAALPAHRAVEFGEAVDGSEAVGVALAEAA